MLIMLKNTELFNRHLEKILVDLKRWIPGVSLPHGGIRPSGIFRS